MSLDFSVLEKWRKWVYGGLVRHDTRSSTRTIADGVLIASVAASVAGIVLGTLPELGGFNRQLIRYVIGVTTIIFTIEYVCRIWVAPEADLNAKTRAWSARWHYLRSFLGVIDLLVILPPYVSLVLPLGHDYANLLMLLALLKSARYAKSLSLFAAVFRNEGRSLLSGMMAMMVLLVLVSGVMFVLERSAQPDVFRSIPHAMWWAIVTMATVGYGDIIPITPLGKVFGGFTMLLGIAMFAVPAGILANGFATEIRKRDFIVTWQTVAGVPLFESLDATRIADIARLLKTQVLPARRVVVRRGEAADAMFFIMSGEVEVDVQPTPVRLGKGKYFGEIALIKDVVRTATVITLGECRLLSLDVNDFRRLMLQYPDLKSAIEHVADERLQHQAPVTPKQEDSTS
ncbi:MAG TPA: cyclic nucleotide-gated ion channel [Thiobacillaceae bacterium]|nr:cyclic nucleotide-gated ion channel [Thiobacillaceae bacterium]